MRKTALGLLLPLLIATTPAMAAPGCKGTDGYAAGFGGRATYSWRADALLAVKTRIDATPASVPAYAALIKDANAALNKGPWSVVDKTRLAPSGDAHDYMSLAPYWWPDPKKADGLPYINRDGEMNPERDTDAFDRTRLGAMASSVETLSLAYYYSGDVKYAERAALILRTWFLDPKTRMNPNLTFAQGVPGTSQGRSFGVIDGAEFLPVVESIGLLAPSNTLSAADMKSLHDWFGAYVDWMTTSDNGKTERSAANNHAIFYDLQLTEFALFSGKVDLARQVASEFGEKRLHTQMAPDGSMPRELARTRSFHYSNWVMQAVFDEATLGECVGVDIWHYDDGEGRSVRKATDFIAAFSGHEGDWKWQEIALNTQDLYDALLKASYGFHDKTLSTTALSHGEAFASARINLTFPAF